MHETEMLISNVRLAREVKRDITIPFDVSHIVLNALQEKLAREKQPEPFGLEHLVEIMCESECPPGVIDVDCEFIPTNTGEKKTDCAGCWKKWIVNHKPNPEPLSLEELAHMSKTDWVWVEYPELTPDENEWRRADAMYALFSHRQYGKTWLAYVHKPRREGNEYGDN